MSDSSSDPTSTTGKGRATPKRKDAEAATRARTATGLSAVALKGPARRRAMRAGDERFIPERFRGEVMTFVRDYVDRKVRVLEFVLPILLIAIFLTLAKVPAMTGISSALQVTTLVFSAYEIYQLRRALNAELTKRYPDASLQGKAIYAISRAAQPKFMRQPHVSIGRGTPLPTRYQWSADTHRWVGMS